MIERLLKQKIEMMIGSEKAIIIMGSRQVGKSTLLREMFADSQDVLWLNGDDLDVQELFEGITSTRLKVIIGKKKFVIIDEAQRIADVGLKLKLITDQVKGVQLIATGSSSFELASKVNEPLTGRKREYKMYPLSFAEMVEHTNLIEEKRMLPHRLIFGYYPEVVTSPGDEKAVLKELADSYLYKDILSLDSIGKPDKLVKLLQALALQIGSQVSYNEIGQLVGFDTKTVDRYIDMLEKNYVIFRLGSFARNLRNELKASRKIYFYDNGIRNAVLANFSMFENRTPEEAGALWENFIISERIKRNAYSGSYCNYWFWRTQQQKEIDYIEEEDGRISTYEFKWDPAAKYKYPQQFIDAYPGSSFEVIHRSNIEEFLLDM
ncbi:MAG: ATP-binding protein [Bacteroides sp.]|nr:ATP-binding protein [Bacteroides sp.]